MAEEAEIYDTKAEARTDPAEFVRSWIEAIDLANEEEAEWRKAARDASTIYRASKESRAAFNILHSNVETIVPALYNSTPTPDCRSRYGDRDAVAEEAARLMERALMSDLDGEDFDETAIGFVRHMEIAGRGGARVRWKPLIHVDPDSGAETVTFDEAPCELFSWEDFRRGPGLNWPDVPWIAYRQRMTKEQITNLLVESYPPAPDVSMMDQATAWAATTEHEAKRAESIREVLAQVSFASRGGDDEKARDRSIFKRAEVWEILDKETRSVIFIATSYTLAPIAVIPDPWGFIGFFDTPRPLYAVKDPDGLVPIVPYDVYKAQADELDKVSKRILALIPMLKYHGLYASEIPELQDIANLDDGEFKPTNGAMDLLAQGGSLANAVWVAPVAELVGVLQQLIAQREQIKQSIYEITGIADILRGASNPTETATAQRIKGQWGSLRIQRAQAEVQRYCRDLFRLKAEIIASKFSERTLEMINGEQVKQEVLALIKSDYMRRCKVDIETDSTIQADLDRSRQNMSEFMSVSSQFMQIAIPAYQQMPMLAPALVEVYMAAASKLKLGKKADEALARVSQMAQQAAAEQQQQAEQTKAEEQRKKQEAEQLQKRIAVAGAEQAEAAVAEKQSKTRKTDAEAQKIAVETRGDVMDQEAERLAMAQMVPMMGPIVQ